MINYIVSLLCGICFGAGLTISHMVNANKILNFLDIAGNWDPSLALVMLSAVVVTAIGYRLVLKQPSPRFAANFNLPEKKTIDSQLIFGAALFGIGWGLAGYCPGPGITALGLGIADAVYFSVGLLISAVLYRQFL